jgi:hypothetical protein
VHRPAEAVQPVQMLGPEQPMSKASQWASASPAAPPQIRAAVLRVPGTSSLGTATSVASSVIDT